MQYRLKGITFSVDSDNGGKNEKMIDDIFMIVFKTKPTFYIIGYATTSTFCGGSRIYGYCEWSSDDKESTIDISNVKEDAEKLFSSIGQKAEINIIDMGTPEDSPSMSSMVVEMIKDMGIVVYAGKFSGEKVLLKNAMSSS